MPSYLGTRCGWEHPFSLATPSGNRELESYCVWVPALTPLSCVTLGKHLESLNSHFFLCDMRSGKRMPHGVT